MRLKGGVSTVAKTLKKGKTMAAPCPKCGSGKPIKRKKQGIYWCPRHGVVRKILSPNTCNVMIKNMTDTEAQNIASAIKITLWEVIQHNMTGPKPHHKNKPIMTALLQMEGRNV